MTWTKREQLPFDVFDACDAVDRAMDESLSCRVLAWARLQAACRPYKAQPLDVFRTYMVGEK